MDDKKSINKKTLTIIAIILLSILIAGIAILAVIKIGKRNTDPTYYEYEIDNSILTNNSSLNEDGLSFTYLSEQNKHEQIVFNAENSVTLGAYGHADSFIFGGINISFTFSINEEGHYLKSVIIDSVKGSNQLSNPNPEAIEKTKYVETLDNDNHTFTVAFYNTEEPLYIYKINLQYSIS